MPRSTLPRPLRDQGKAPAGKSPPSASGGSNSTVPQNVEPKNTAVMPAAASQGQVVSSQNQIHVKVTSLAIAAEERKIDEKGSSINMLPLTTLSFNASNRDSFASQTKLTQIRDRIEEFIAGNKTPFKFCSPDCSIVNDDLSLSTYLQLLRSTVNNTTQTVEVFITAFESSETTSTLLATPPFQLKFIQKTEGSVLNEGSLHSSAFQGKDAGTMALSELRKLITKMSRDPRMHTFCSADGTAVGDELNLSDYLKLDNAPVTDETGVPSIHIIFRKSGSTRFEPPASGGGSKFHGASADILAKLEQMKPDLTLRDRSAEELKMDTSEFRVQEQLDASQLAARDANPAKFTSQMDENDWNQVLRNCSLLYGWKVDKKTNTITRATTPAFKLRSNIVLPEPLPPLEDGDRPLEPPPAIKDVQVPEQAASDNFDPEDEYGIKNGIDTPSESEATMVEEIQAPPEPPVTVDSLRAVIPDKPGVIPSFVLNDNSKIEITVVSHAFQKSMAENHFSASSIEASVSGGYGGFSAGVTGGYGEEKASGTSSSNKTFSKTMVATYKFPRVTMYMRPEDLEPTEELKAALDNVRKSKNINSLRKLHSTFGHLFCTEATLGGCLQTTKVVTGTETGTTTMNKEGFKAQVGVAVSTPVGIGASMKASTEKQDKKETDEKTTDTREAMVFEATGGNTILAADPPAWSGSVADFNNWRVIDQTGLSPLADIISQMRSYGGVKQWFLQAVPKLSEYVVIPESRLLNVRFKVLGDGSVSRISGQAECAYLGHETDEKKAPRPIRLSLEMNTPIEKIVEHVSQGRWGSSIDLTHSTTQVEVTNQDTMFFPHSTQAPIIMFPGIADANKVKELSLGGGAVVDVVSNDSVGTMGDSNLRKTVWRLEVPEKYSLGSDCVVCIKSVARTTTMSIPPTVAPKANEPSPPPKTSEIELPAALSVYRNQQGVFLPCITSSDEPSYWRIERVTTNGGKSDARIKHGEEVRLCWRFSDQVSGFRDYYDDLYGRRRFHRPAEIEYDSLYLKSPYPRFESLQSAGMAMVMSPAITKDPIVHTLNVLPIKGESGGKMLNYTFHDLTFRLDAVGNDGWGDASDYMNIVSGARTTSELIREWGFWNQHREENFVNKLLSGGPETVIAGCILGPIAVPIAGFARIMSSIFDF